MTIKRGTLVLVVGPSGCGKDSLIQSVREEFAENPYFIFPKRVITRAEHSSSEEHIHTTMDGFQVAEEGNAFLLHWHAHGHAYGVPGHLAHDLDQGRHVVVNVSRGVIQEAQRLINPVLVVSVTTKLDTAFQRLKERGREGEEEIAQRLKRFDFPIPATAEVREIDNNGSYPESVARFRDILNKLQG